MPKITEKEQGQVNFLLKQTAKLKNIALVKEWKPISKVFNSYLTAPSRHTKIKCSSLKNLCQQNTPQTKTIHDYFIILSR